MRIKIRLLMKVKPTCDENDANGSSWPIAAVSGSTAKVDSLAIGGANALDNHVRYVGKTSQCRGWFDACT